MRKRQIQIGLIILFFVVLAFAAGNTKIDYAKKITFDGEISGQEYESHGDRQRETEFDGVSIQKTEGIGEDDVYGRTPSGLNKKLAVAQETLEEETFFEAVYRHLEDLKSQYQDKGILCFVDAKSNIVGVEVEDSDIHCLYALDGNEFYEFEGSVAHRQRDFYGLRTIVIWRNIEMSLSEDCQIISMDGTKEQPEGDRFYLCYQETDTEDDVWLHEVSVCPTKPLPEYETADKMRDYFMAGYPDMGYYAAHPSDDETNDACFYMAGEERALHGFYEYGGQAYEVTDKVDQDGYDWDWWRSIVDDIRNQLNYAYRETYIWKQTDQSTFWRDDEVGNIYLEGDIGEGKRFSFQIQRLQDEAEHKSFYEKYQVDVYRSEEASPFQAFEVYVEGNFGGDAGVFFEDFNADGFLDLTVIENYGANGGSAAHFLWSPSRDCFVRGPERLEYYGSYGINPEDRRLHMHWHGSAVSGEDFLYQWENETDCVLLKYIDYSYSDDKGEKILIVRGEGDKEQTLVNYVETRKFDNWNSWGLFWDDLVWERNITNPETGMRYMVYFAQEPMYDNKGEETGEFSSRFYVVDDALSLANYVEWEGNVPYAEVLWEDAGEEGAITVRYEDGLETVYAATEILCEK